VEPGDEVVTSAFSFFATAEAILQCGAHPVFADIEPAGFSLAPSGFEAAVTQRTRAVVPVHLFGRCADMPRIAAIAGRHGVVVVEDAAQSIGAARAGRRAGAWGAAGCFSFYPAKNLGGAGDGGGVTTSEPEVAERLRLLRSHGACADGGHVLVGTTSRLDSLQAAVLRAKLPYLEVWTNARARNARIYAEELAGCPGVGLPGGAPGEEIVWSQYTIRCREPERVRTALEARGIEWRHYYPRPVCEEPGLGEFRRPAAEFPEATRACAEVISLPVRASCSPEVIRETAGVIRDSLGTR
jgi:dTDP-4-amino-4,6-dideoxygalactose transaminase